jgi:wobble nucleotide-excising tRNase
LSSALPSEKETQVLSQLQLLRNVGQFDSVSTGSTITLTSLTLIYAENGRGKTTLAAILRSLGNNDPIPILERRRLAAANPPHVVLDCSGGPPKAIFQNNAWNRTVPHIYVFDDIFVHENVCSGLEVDTAHRQRLHELILGSHAVSLTRQLQQHVDAVESHNKTLRAKSDAIPAATRGTFTVDAFCALKPKENVESEIDATERALAAAQATEPIRVTAGFDQLSLPPIALNDLEGILNRDLPELDAAAAAKVTAHLASIGPRGEAWVAEGITRIQPTADAAVCPFCGQNLSGSSLLQHYRTYFSDAYASLKQSITENIQRFSRLLGDDSLGTFERSARTAAERKQFWSRFCDVPDIGLDMQATVETWRSVREGILAVLRAKQASPLERLILADPLVEALARFNACGDTTVQFNQQLTSTNADIQIVKERAAASNVASIKTDLARLQAIKARYQEDTARLCKDYLDAKAAKATADKDRDQAKAALQQYRDTVFPAYQTSINEYLRRFNTGFRLGEVRAVDTRGGPTCTYNVVINATPVPVAGAATAAGEPSFRTTLSSGDRNTLALAFFFALLDQDKALSNKIIVIDDPITSLDEHRSLTTVQEMRRLQDHSSQVILLSHNKSFLCRMWEGAIASPRTAIRLKRDGDGSTIDTWDVTADCVTEHDHRHARLREYVSRQTPNAQEIAADIRPLLEAYVRIACPEHFPPGTTLGPFLGLCDQRIASPQEILCDSDIVELRELVEYANRFHHDSSHPHHSVVINDAELLHFVERALEFTRV